MKKNYISAFMLAVLTLFLISAPIIIAAKPLKINQILDAMQQRYEKTATYKTDFEQTLTSEAFKKVIRQASGTIYFQKPGKIRWDYEKPEKHVYLIDSENFWDYDVGQKQVIKIPVKDALAGHVPQGFLFGAGNFGKDFDVKLIGHNDQEPHRGYKIALTPKDKELRAVITNLEMLVDDRDFAVTEAQFNDAQGNVNLYVFTKSELNPELKQDLFVFTIPDGVKVILPVTPGEGPQ